jgi:hypothetical protein
MAVVITGIHPKPNLPLPTNPDEIIQAHLSIENFQWVNEQTQARGTSSRASMFDWIVNQKGRASVRRKRDTNLVSVFGANASTGGYIRCAENGKWTNDLLEVDPIV